MRLDHLLSKELISIRPHILGVAGVLALWGGCSSSGVLLVLVAEAMPRPYASGVVAHGWNIDEEFLSRVLEASTSTSSPACRRGVRGWNVEGVRGWACQAHCWVLRQPACPPLWGCRGFLEVRVTGSRSYLLVSSLLGPSGPWCVVVSGVVSGVGWWVRPLLENCIVDASIFEFFQDCDRGTYDHGSLTCGCCFVVFLGFCDFVLLKFFRAHWWMPWH